MSLKTNLESLATAISTQVKSLRIMITGTSTGTLASLQTTDKASIIAAINEARTTGGSGSPPTATETVAGVIEIATLAEVTAGTDSTRAVTAQGVKQAADAVKASILGAGVPAALDTLDEIAAALADDANYAASVTTALSNKQPLDADLTAIAALVSAANKFPYATGAGTWSLADITVAGRAILDDADVAAQRTTLDVYSKTEIGNPETDLVAVFNAGLL